MIEGHATVDGTAEYFNSRKELGGWLEGLGLHCSRVGFGGYRVNEISPVYSEALKTALIEGCNLIDTSTNYADGGSERLVGKALSEMIQVGILDRNQVILVSKVGYVQGQALELARTREAEGNPFPDMVKYQDDCWHCLHPDFLSIQLEKSLERLQMQCLDFYLLHNPEYYLMDAARRGSSVLLPKLREQFYARVAKAFEFLEAQVQLGKIQAYGVSSNSLGAPASRADATSVSQFLKIAEDLAVKRGGAPDSHHFRLIQLPLNLYESGPGHEKNTGADGSMTALEFASKYHLAVLVNRPLNAFTQQQLVRLADFATIPEPLSWKELLAQVDKLESEFSQTIAPFLKIGADEGVAADLFRWAKDLSEVHSLGLGADRWGQIEEQIREHVRYLCDQLTTQLEPGPWHDWHKKYLPILDRLLIVFRNEAGARSQKTSIQVAQKLDPYLPEEWKKETLSRKALGVLIHTPGVSCVLNGMRNADYVHDSLGATKLPRLSEIAVRKIYFAFQTS